MIFMKCRIKEGIIAAEPGGEWWVLVELPRFDVKLFVIIGVQDVQFIWCYPYDGAYRQQFQF